MQQLLSVTGRIITQIMEGQGAAPSCPFRFGFNGTHPIGSCHKPRRPCGRILPYSRLEKPLIPATKMGKDLRCKKFAITSYWEYLVPDLFDAPIRAHRSFVKWSIQHEPTTVLKSRQTN